MGLMGWWLLDWGDFEMACEYVGPEVFGGIVGEPEVTWARGLGACGGGRSGSRCVVVIIIITIWVWSVGVLVDAVVRGRRCLPHASEIWTAIGIDGDGAGSYASHGVFGLVVGTAGYHSSLGGGKDAGDVGDEVFGNHHGVHGAVAGGFGECRVVRGPEG